MEILQKYWYVALGAVILLFVFSRRSGGDLQQLTAGTDTVALAQIAAAERESDENRRFGLANALLGYDLTSVQTGINAELARLQLGQNLDLARIAAEAQSNAAASAYQLAILENNTRRYESDLEFRLAQYAQQRNFNANRRNDWLSALQTGLQTFSPYLMGQASGGFNLPRVWGTPSTFPRI